MKNCSVAPSRVTADSEQMNPPAPRLQLRWQAFVGQSWFGANWQCHYELVLPLAAHDIRREIYNDDGEQIGERSELVVPLKGATQRGGTGTPCVARDTGELFFDPPFRDGAHAEWDSEVLGDLPIYVIAPCGTAIPKPSDSTRDGS